MANSGSTGTLARMTGAERSRLKQLEDIVSENLKAMLVAWAALAEIKESKLYREQYATWAEYCISVWGYSESYVRKNLDGSKVVLRISEAVNSDNCPKNGDVVLPARESQVRALVPLSDSEQVEVWQLVVGHHKKTGDPITAKLVETIVKTWKKYQQRNTIEVVYEEIKGGSEQQQQEEMKLGDSEDIAPPSPKKRGQYTEDRGSRESEEFNTAALEFFKLIDKEVSGNYRNVSRKQIEKTLRGMLFIVET